MPVSEQSSEAGLSLVHWGLFSGTVPMMREPLQRQVHTVYHDFGALTRVPSLLPSRAMAQLACIGRSGPWFKTGIWSKAIQRHAIEAGWIRKDRPTLFFQTLGAPVLGPDYRYSIYTDRLAREGAAEAEPFRSTWGPGWIEREEEFLARAESIFVMGPSSKTALETLYGMDSAKVRVVGAGPGTGIGPINRKRRPAHRLLFVGTNWGLKGGPEVVAAFSRVSERNPDLELVLVGSDPVGPIPGRARALGRVAGSTMPELFADSDIFVVPTHMEALGYSLLEALLQGLPAIGSTVGNQGWLIGDAGTTVEPGNVDQIEQAIETVVADFEDYKTRAIRRAELLRETMTWDRVASAIAGSLLKRHDRSA
jgi:glycosyltransferase involved in cell wall biosynthesis